MDPKTFTESKKIAKEGGEVSKIARILAEERSGRPIITDKRTKPGKTIPEIRLGRKQDE